MDLHFGVKRCVLASTAAGPECVETSRCVCRGSHRERDAHANGAAFLRHWTARFPKC